MKNYYIILINCLIALGINFSSCQIQRSQKLNYKHPIPYQPLHYICHKTNDTLRIDGKLDELVWQRVKPTEDFQDIQGNLKPQPPFQTYVKMLWSDEYFYFGAYLEEPHIWATLTERDAVIFRDNDFEIFIDPNSDTHQYYEFEINAFNTIWDLLLLHPYRDKGLKVLNSWDIRGIQTAVHINGTLNNPTDIDTSWTIEIAIPWKVLNEMSPKSLHPKNGIQWRINFSRVNWHMDTSTGQYQKQKDSTGKRLPEENWVWSPQGYINMHAPETWGIVQFSDLVAESKYFRSLEVRYAPNDDEAIKWELRKLYYQQRQFYKKYKVYASSLRHFTFPREIIVNTYLEERRYKFKPKITKTYTGYQIKALSKYRDHYWIIQEDGLIQKGKRDSFK